MPDREENIKDSFVRIREFDDRNKDDYQMFPKAVANFTIIREVIPILDAYFAAKTSGARGRAVERKSVISAAMKRKMKAMSKTARALNLDDPSFSRLFHVPNDKSYARQLASAREFVEEGNKHKEAMIALAMRPTLIDELSADIAAFDLAEDDKANAQSETVGATAGVDATIDRGMSAAKILDAMMKNVYDDDPVKLAEWEQARHIKRAPKRNNNGTPNTPVS